jgi:hypothetical protein
MLKHIKIGYYKYLYYIYKNKKINIMKKIKFLLFGLLVSLFSCGDNGENIKKRIKKEQTGILKVLSVESINSKICSYLIEGKDIRNQTGLGQFVIECDCGKFNPNDRLELVSINEKNVEKKEMFYLIDSDGNITVAKTNQTEGDLKTILLDLKNDTHEYKNKIHNQDSIIKKQKTEMDSLNKIINNIINNIK